MGCCQCTGQCRSSSDKGETSVADGQYKSRKLWLTIVAIVLIVGAAIASAFWLPLQAVYATMVSGILGVCALYFGGNVAAKHVLCKFGGTCTTADKS